MAAGLIGRGADRVIAMLAPVTDGYATALARHLYQELAARPELTAGQALARARYLAEEDRSRGRPDRVPVPEYGVATLLAAGGDGPLVDPAAAAGAADGGDGAAGRQAGAGAADGRADRPPRPAARRRWACCAATRRRWTGSGRPAGWC